MPAANPILTPDRGKAHSVAMAVLCGLAAIQVSAMARAVWLAKYRAAQPSETTSVLGGTPSDPLGPPPTQIAGAALIPPPAIPTGTASTPSPPLPGGNVYPTAPAVSPAASVMPKASAEVIELVEVAQQSRPLGDLQGALEALRRADTLSPDHPLVLLEMAQTYDQMGLTEKALAAWTKLQAMGPKAGEGYSRAAQRLGTSSASAIDSGTATLSPATGLTTPTSTKPLDASKTLGLGPCEVMRDPAISRGERLTLRIPILSQPGQAIDPSAVDINVFFFDMVNGERVEQTKADVPVNSWVQAPVDWTEGSELLDVVYFMPETLDAAALRSQGVRKYHGYIVKLYYQNKLQDTVMEPSSLQNFGNSGSFSGAGNPLLPPVGR